MSSETTYPLSTARAAAAVIEGATQLLRLIEAHDRVSPPHLKGPTPLPDEQMTALLDALDSFVAATKDLEI
jgi:hypothetical protein